MSEFLRKYQIIIGLSFVVMVMAVVKMVYKPTEEPVLKEIVVTITPTAVPTVPTDNYEEKADKLMPLWRLLPYQGDGFVVENYAEVGVLIVRKKSITEAETKKRVEKWIVDQKQDPKEYQLEISD